MITMYLVRHGQTVENLQRIFQGHLPGMLTEEGRLQAIGLGPQLEDLALDAVVSSDLQRVVDTVKLAFGMDVGVMNAGVTNADMMDSVIADPRATDVEDMLVWHGRMIPWERTQLLREMDWGSWTGLTIASVDTTLLPDECRFTPT